MINCHLGSGASLCAIDHGRSVDTSMGTRCRDLDPGVLANERVELRGCHTNIVLQERRSDPR